jgi:hypothetical protein
VGYNPQMRVALIAGLLALALLPLAAQAGDCAAGISRSARGCIAACSDCNRITTLHLCAVSRDCTSLPHKCAVPFDPGGRSCLPEACHKPATPLFPCPEVLCLERPCHKPAVGLFLVDECPCMPELTGSPELIVVPCGWED